MNYVHIFVGRMKVFEAVQHLPQLNKRIYSHRQFNCTNKITYHRDMSSIPSSRNIEIKARIRNEAEYRNRVDIAKKLTGTEGEIIPQHDVFFKVPNGRLKLRYLKTGKSVLVQYSRPDVTGPKLSEFSLFETDEPEVLHKMLEASLGVLGEVKKTRYLFLHDQTRVHLDNVEGLGHFLEFEVCLRPEQTVEEGTAIADTMMEIFEIKKDDLLAGAYLDELIKN